MIALLVLSLLAQDEVRISKSVKAQYQPHIIKARDARALIESNPSLAIEELSNVISAAPGDKIECRVRIELQGGTYSPAEDYFPYQWRGLARMKRAERVGVPAEKVRLLEQACDDFRVSVEKGLESSKAHQSQGEAALAEARKALDTTPKVDREPGFRRQLKDYIETRRFKAAKDHVNAEKDAFMTDAVRKACLAEVDAAIRAYQQEATDSFLSRAGDTTSARDFEDMTASTFRRAFALPEREELCDTFTPAYNWCVKARAAFQLMHESKDALANLADCAVEGVALVDKDENRWFTVPERLAWNIVEGRLRQKVADAGRAAAEERTKLRTECEKLATAWDAFQKRVAQVAKSDFLAKVEKRDCQGIIANFPVDAEGLDKLIAQVDSSALADTPVQALRDVEKELLKALENPRLTLESRRRLLSYAVVAIALRTQVSGRSSRDAVEECAELKSGLKSAGGPSPEVARYGPKVAAVFNALR